MKNRPAIGVWGPRSIIGAGLLAMFLVNAAAWGAELSVVLRNLPDVRAVGAVQRWDKDGNHRKPVDPKATINAIEVDAKAASAEPGRWVFKDLPPGKYDLVILGKQRLRIEGFEFAPVKEFDPFLSADAKVEPDTQAKIADLVKKAPHYENRVTPLHMAGDEKTIRVLVELVRDKPTSYERDFPGAATIRHEIWQFDWNYGGWQKNKRTQVLDRVMLHRDELRKWTWIWEPKLGGIEVQDKPLTITYDFPQKLPASP